MPRAILAAVLLLAGCAETQYGPDGRREYTVDCPGVRQTMDACYRQAGEICGASGYELVASSSDKAAIRFPNQTDGPTGLAYHRSLLISCNGTPAEVVPALPPDKAE